MQPEGPNKSEELLQRYAKQRREQSGDFSLHPATRRLLQSEVTRQFGAGKREERSALGWLGLWRGRFAVAVATVVVLATGAWIFLKDRGSHPMELADAKTSAKTELFGRSLNYDARPEKEIVSEPRSLERKLAENPVALRSAAPAVQAPMPAQNPASVKRERYYAALGAAATSSIASSSLSLAPAANGGAKPADGLASVESLAANSVAEAGQATASFAYNVPTTLPQMAAKDAAQVSGASRLSDAPQSKTDPSLGTRGDFGENRAAALRKELPASQTAQPARGPAQTLAFDKAKRAEKLDRLEENTPTAALGVRSSDAITFFRLDESGSQKQVDLTKTASDQLKRKSELTTSPVLAHFTIEQRGRTVRVVDADGSVYTGDMDAPVAAEFEARTAGEKAEMLREKTVALPEPNVSRAREASFRASGSNVTLHQFVVVNGTFTQSTNVSNVPNGAVAGGANGRLNAAAPSSELAVRRGLASGGSFARTANAITNSPVAIEGTIRIGATNLQWFKAARESR